WRLGPGQVGSDSKREARSGLSRIVPVTAGLAAGVFVGRDDEVARLGGLVDELAAGRGRAVWVEGEPGIGKSALLAAGLDRAARLGCEVFWATAYDVGVQ